MSTTVTLAVVSDIHYACSAEQARGDHFESRCVRNPLIRMLLKAYRRFIWLDRPLHQNHLLDCFFDQVGDVDHVIANGDFSCDTSFVGVSDDASFESARECLGKLRQRFPGRFRAVMGDHELGKFSLAGACGGMRLASYFRAVDELAIQPFWSFRIRRRIFIGITSSLVALPVFAREVLPEEEERWERLREEHLDAIRREFSSVTKDEQIVLFCHDPTALPFLWQEEVVRSRQFQIQKTIIGHLHSRFILGKSRILAGIPPIRCCGHAVARMSTALNQARVWRPFNVHLCPSLAGIELLKDGGFLRVECDPEGREPLRISTCPIPR